MGDRRKYLIDRIVWVCKRLDDKGFGANHDGNVTAKFEDKILATPTSTCKGLVTPETIITCDKEGKKIEGIGLPFSEIGLHLAAYKVRTDINAVVHAHPPFATAMGLIGKNLRPSIPEAVISIGEEIPVLHFCMPGSPDSENAVATVLQTTDVFMMQGNGVFAVGTDVEQAYLRLELVEHVAKIQFYAQSSGKIFEIPRADLEKLLEKRASLGLGPKIKKMGDENKQISGEVQVTIDMIREIIVEEISKFIKS